MTNINSLILEVDDLSAATAFYDAFVDLPIQLRQTDAPSTGFRGFSISLLVAQPADVLAVIDAAAEAGATVVKPAVKSFWGFGGVVQAPDGTIWKVASSSKKDTGPATSAITQVVLLLGVDDVKATKQFYVDQGFEVARSFGGKYAELDTGETVTLALYKRAANAKDAGVSPEGSGSHRLAIAADLEVTDPDGYLWEKATQRTTR